MFWLAVVAEVEESKRDQKPISYILAWKPNNPDDENLEPSD